MSYHITSQPERSLALAHMNSQLDGTCLYRKIDKSKFYDDTSVVTIICPPGLPERQDYRYGWGGSAPVAIDWLATKILEHLLAADSNMCMLEDFCGSPSDPNSVSGGPGPAWFCDGHILWPIISYMGNIDIIRKAMAWGLVGRPQVIAFCNVPKSVTDLRASLHLDECTLDEIGYSTTRLVTDVFDEEGFMSWERKCDGDQISGR